MGTDDDSKRPGTSTLAEETRAWARGQAVAVKWRLASLRIRDSRGSEIPTYLVFGSPRSATTWLAEVVDRHHDHRLLFEPLIPGDVLGGRRSATRDLDPLKTTYLPPDRGQARFVVPFRRLLNGELKDPWMDHMNRTWRPRRRLVKEVRGNGLVPWICRHFPAVPIVVLLRHPVSVALSRRRLGWQDGLDRYLSNDLLLERFVDDPGPLHDLDEPLARDVARWALETLVPLSVAGLPNVMIASYEVIRRDSAALGRVLAHLDQSLDAAVAAATSSRSRTDWNRSSRPDPLAELTTRDRRIVDGVLDRFGLLDVYSTASLTPGAVLLDGIR